MIENPVIEQQTDKTWLRQKDIAKKKGGTKMITPYHQN